MNVLDMLWSVLHVLTLNPHYEPTNQMNKLRLKENK